MDITVGSIITWIGLGFGAILVLSFLVSCFVTTEQNTKRVIQRFGKFVGVRSAGMSMKMGWFDKASKPISLRTQQLDVSELTYTDTGTSVTISAQIQYKVDENDSSVKDAYFKLASPEAQIKSHVSSAIRSKVPTMTLTAVQTNQNEIAAHVKTELTETMGKYGYIIEDVLVTKADPDPAVVKANNDKYASEQAKVTAKNNADARYTQVTRAAEADRDAMKAHGEGIALERQAITDGMEKAIKTLEGAVQGATAQDVLALVGYQQYIDGLVKIAANAGSKVIFVDKNASASADLMAQLRQTLITSSEASRPVELNKPAGEAAPQQ
jgi:regulator of protease activity HflC (stomatin/prohibitin superfamily)